MISAILLAAGQSRRMQGENKLTKKIQGIPLIKHSVKNILSSSIDELIVVFGHENEIVEKLVEKNERVKFVFNKNFKIGMSSSIKIGIRNLSDKTDYFFICLGDMPFVDQNTYNLLIKHKNKSKIIVPTYNGQQGNPVLFAKSMVDQITTIQGDVGAKKILNVNKDKVTNVKIHNESVIKSFNLKENF